MIPPRLCAHKRLEYFIAQDYMIAKCDLCGLSGGPVPVTRIQWWTRARATSEFFKTAQKTDRSLICPEKN